MVTNVTSLGRSGLYDWLIQRASSVVIALYVFVLVGYLMLTPELDYQTWRAFMGGFGMKLFSMITLFSIIAHAWVGMWTISTDYIKPMVLRFVFQGACCIAALAYVVWAIDILWRL